MNDIAKKYRLQARSNSALIVLEYFLNLSCVLGTAWLVCRMIQSITGVQIFDVVTMSIVATICFVIEKSLKSIRQLPLF